MRSETVPRAKARMEGMLSGVRRLAFWIAVLLPLAYLGLLATPVGRQELTVVAALVAVNVVCLVVGHDHSP